MERFGCNPSSAKRQNNKIIPPYEYIVMIQVEHAITIKMNKLTRIHLARNVGFDYFVGYFP